MPLGVLLPAFPPPVRLLSSQSSNESEEREDLRNAYPRFHFRQVSQGFRTSAWDNTSNQPQSLPSFPVPSTGFESAKSNPKAQMEMTTYRRQHDELKSDLSHLLNEDYDRYQHRPIDRVDPFFEPGTVRRVSSSRMENNLHAQTPASVGSPLLPLPHTIKAPQSNLSDLATEVSSLSSCLLLY
jgi:hypothetical protein